MIRHFDFQSPHERLRLVSPDLVSDSIDLLQITRQCHTVRAVLAGYHHAVDEIRGHELTAHSDSQHSTGNALPLGNLSTVEGDHDGVVGIDDVGCVCCRNFPT